MDTPDLNVYRELADHYDRLGQASMRDRFLMLAADAAAQAGMRDEAEKLRQRLLAGNKHHMLRPYASFDEATRAADVQSYLEGLRANYPPDQARDMLNSFRGGDDAPAPAKPPAPAPAKAPAPAAQPRLIPPTAPLLDVNASARQQRPLAEERPFEPMKVDPAPPRPRAQPPAPTAKGPQPPLREIPLGPAPPPKKKEDRAPRPAPPPVRPSPLPPLPPEPQKGAWFNGLLAVAAAAVALALLGIALGRPFVR